MARAHSVWVITINWKLVAAFTVKHEARSWLRRMAKGWNVIQITRVPDGGSGDPVDVPVKEFMEVGR